MNLHLFDSNSRIILAPPPSVPFFIALPILGNFELGSMRSPPRRKKTRAGKQFCQAESAQRPSPRFFSPGQHKFARRLRRTPFQRVLHNPPSFATNDLGVWEGAKGGSRSAAEHNRHSAKIPSNGLADGWLENSRDQPASRGIIFFVFAGSLAGGRTSVLGRIGD